MKIEINGIKREVQIMPAPSKCFCIFEECCTPSTLYMWVFVRL